MSAWGRWDKWAKWGEWGGGGETPLEWILLDKFTTADAAPLPASWDAEPGPGTGYIVTDADGNCFKANGVFSLVQVAAEGPPAYMWKGDPQLNLVAGDALHCIATSKSANQWMQFGKGNSAGATLSPRIYGTGFYQSNGAVVNGLFPSLIQDAITKPLIVLRSVGSFCIWDGKLRWAEQIQSAAAANVSLIARSAYGSVTWTVELDQAGVANLPDNGYSKFGPDFSTITDSEVDPASYTVFDVDADFLLDNTITVENTKRDQIKFRLLDATHYVFLEISTSRQILLRHRDGAGYTTLFSGSTLTDGVEYNIKILGHGSSISVFLDNVLDNSGTLTYQQGQAGGNTYSTYVTRGTFSTHPYPALGIATSRIIAPQAADTATHEADCLVYGRSVTLPSAGSLQYETRKSGADEITLDIDSAGKPIIKENGVARITGSNADVTDGDDWGEILDDTDVSLFVEGTKIGATYSSLSLTGGTIFNMASIGTGGATDSVECYPRNVVPLLPSALV